MLRKHQVRCTASAVLTVMLLALSVGPVQVARAQCADPRGNAYCTNGGLVGQNPNPGGLVNGQNPNPGRPVTSQNPNPNGSVAQNTPSAPAQPQAPQSSPPANSSSPAVASGIVTVDPPGAPAGATVTVSGSGLPANASFVVNLAQLKTASGQTYGAANMQAADGASLQADSGGNFSGTFTVPTVPDFIDPQGSVCAVILGMAAYCAPFLLQSVGLGVDSQPSGDPAAGTVDGTGTTFCYSCEVLTNDDARRYGSYNSGSGQYEYHGAQP